MVSVIYNREHRSLTGFAENPNAYDLLSDPARRPFTRLCSPWVSGSSCLVNPKPRGEGVGIRVLSLSLTPASLGFGYLEVCWFSSCCRVER